MGSDPCPGSFKDGVRTNARPLASGTHLSPWLTLDRPDVPTQQTVPRGYAAMLRCQLLEPLQDILLGVCRRVIRETDEDAAVLLVRLHCDDVEAVVLRIGEEGVELVDKGLLPKVAHVATDAENVQKHVETSQ